MLRLFRVVVIQLLVLWFKKIYKVRSPIKVPSHEILGAQYFSFYEKSKFFQSPSPWHLGTFTAQSCLFSYLFLAFTPFTLIVIGQWTNSLIEWTINPFNYILQIKIRYYAFQECWLACWLSDIDLNTMPVKHDWWETVSWSLLTKKIINKICCHQEVPRSSFLNIFRKTRVNTIYVFVHSNSMGITVIPSKLKQYAVSTVILTKTWIFFGKTTLWW